MMNNKNIKISCIYSDLAIYGLSLKLKHTASKKEIIENLFKSREIILEGLPKKGLIVIKNSFEYFIKSQDIKDPYHIYLCSKLICIKKVGNKKTYSIYRFNNRYIYEFVERYFNERKQRAG